MPALLLSVAIVLSVAVPIEMAGEPQTSAVSEDKARLHYKVALIALKNGDLDTALSSLEKAATTAPDNALIEYNLAIVWSKKDKASEALKHLKRAKELGLPKEHETDAEDLEASLVYSTSKSSSANLRQLMGTWQSSGSETGEAKGWGCCGITWSSRWERTISVDEADLGDSTGTGFSKYSVSYRPLRQLECTYDWPDCPPPAAHTTTFKHTFTYDQAARGIREHMELLSCEGGCDSDYGSRSVDYLITFLSATEFKRTITSDLSGIASVYRKIR